LGESVFLNRSLKFDAAGGKIVVTRNPIQKVTGLIYAIIHVWFVFCPFRLPQLLPVSPNISLSVILKMKTGNLHFLQELHRGL
jgi:hypothetical protein